MLWGVMSNLITLPVKQVTQTVNSTALRKARARCKLDVSYTLFIDSLSCQDFDVCDIVHEINHAMQKAVDNDALDYIMLSVNDA